MDLSRAEILKLARKAAAEHPGARIHFKFTCPKCRERCVLEEADTLYQRGICFRCGSDSPIEKAGFLMIGDASEQAEGGVR
jgi:hypothetical protein